jgi:hypothetical protein
MTASCAHDICKDGERIKDGLRSFIADGCVRLGCCGACELVKFAELRDLEFYVITCHQHVH